LIQVLGGFLRVSDNFHVELKMEINRATPQEVAEIIEQQKKLQEMRKKLVGVLEKVNETINAITVSGSSETI
jgi:predicted component of type VI protein secretion system